MRAARGLCLVALVLNGAGLVGCQTADRAAKMEPPARPAELDRLEAFRGSWRTTGEIVVPGSDQAITGSGVLSVDWEADRWALLERYEGSVGEGGEFAGLVVWIWDDQAGKYRNYVFDSGGGIGEGTATYDEATGNWHLKWKTRNTVTGERSVGESTFAFPDDVTWEWKHTEWDGLKLVKSAEMTGTHRKK